MKKIGEGGVWIGSGKIGRVLDEMLKNRGGGGGVTPLSMFMTPSLTKILNNINRFALYPKSI